MDRRGEILTNKFADLAHAYFCLQSAKTIHCFSCFQMRFDDAEALELMHESGRFLICNCQMSVSKSVRSVGSLLPW